MEFVIDASELFQKAKEMLNDGKNRVIIDLLEEDTTLPDDPTPPCVAFSAFNTRTPFEVVDYDEIYVVDSTSTETE